MDNSEEERLEKQNYLRQEIIEKEYDAYDFVEYCNGVKEGKYAF
jgi:hypothetical protein